MKKLLIIIIIALVLLGLLSAGFFYLKNIFVPKTLRVLIEKSVSDSTNLKIGIGSITYELFSGVVIKDVALYQPGQTPQQGPFLIKKLSFNVLLLPSLKGKTIIIPALYIEQPHISIERQKDQTWNIQHFLKKTQIPATQQPPLIIAKIKILKGDFLVKDETTVPGFSQQLANVNIDLSPGGFKDIGFKVSADIPDKSQQGKISVDGRFNVTKQVLMAQCEAKQLELSEILHYFKTPTITTLPIQNTKTAIRYSFLDQSLNLDSKTQLGTFDFQNASLSGQLQAKFALSVTVKSLLKTPQVSSLSGQIYLWDSKVEGIENIGSLEKIKTKITLKDNLASFEEFEGVWQGNKITASGQANLPFIKTKEDIPLLVIDASGNNLNVSKIIALLPTDSAKAIEKASGVADLKAHLMLKKQPDTSIKPYFTINAQLKDGYLKLANLNQEISKISGTISVDNDKLAWDKLNLFLYAQDFITSGSLADFAAPRVDCQISSKLFRAAGKFSVKDNTANIEDLKLTSFDSSLTASGTVAFLKDNTALLDLNAQIKLATQNLAQWLPQWQENLKQVAPQGTMAIKAKISGPASSLADWNLGLTAQSELMKLYGFSLKNITLAYNQNTQILQEASAAFDFYGGQFTIKGNGPISSLGWDINLDANLDNVDIAKLKLDTEFKNKDLSGILSAKTRLNLKKPLPEAITGDGELAIKEGVIWEMRPLKKLGEFLLLPEFSHIIFNQGQATFTIRDKQISTGDLALISPQLNLKADGTLGFDGGLNFEVYCEFSQKYLENSDDLRKLITNFFAQLNQYITVKVTGNISSPQYSIIPINIKTFLDPLKQFLGGE